ncbi:MAG TPA: S8/S53 family peptidase [Actinophytocola sp.]|uniref:S8 family peptidase n=1 Tax=Actinophytocola sp. TaxID=1872138 RepID=UPI002DBA8E47|nr:S8/S53 family peptidase [Actinophytocola sp.]HEU5469188.1 S8/S53 family peptidase [Actinophytocola sp.]
MNDKRGHGQNMVTRGRWRTEDSVSAAQFEAVKRAAAANLPEPVTFETQPTEGPPQHIWQKDHILVHHSVNETHEALTPLGAELALRPNGMHQEVYPDLVKLLRLRNPQGQRTDEIVANLDRIPDLNGKVFVNNLVYATHEDGGNICPGDEPTPVRPYPHTIPYPPPSRGDAGRGVRIVVIDTGLSEGWRDNHPWLHDPKNPSNEVTGQREQKTFDDNRDIASHAGHGMFIAGLIRCIAPRASVNVLNTLRWAGTMLEHEIAYTIREVLTWDPPDIISFSAGYMIHTAEPGGAMSDVMVMLRRPGCPTVLVAAVGNDGHGPKDHGLFYPAAFAGKTRTDVADGRLVAVGALRQDRRGRTCFSNYGSWVTVYEEGEKLINAFPSGRYTYHEPISSVDPPQCLYYPNPVSGIMKLQDGCSCVTAPAKGGVALFNGMAAWSGTSFATPLVAARIARHMTENTEFAGKPRDAVRDLLAGHLDTIIDAGDTDTTLPVFSKPLVP